MSKLHVTVEHGGQRVEFESPAGEGNPGITDDFGGVFDVVTKPAKAVAKGVKKATGSVEKFTRSAANAAGHGAHTLTRATNRVTGEVTDLARKVPVVGKPLNAVVGASIEPLKVATAVASGRRIDKAVVDSFRRSVAQAKTLAPYAQLVVSAVPGIGTGLSAAMAGGLALAEGRSINDATVAAARAAVPGGPMATAAFDAAVAVGSGKGIDEAATEAAVAAAAPDPASRGRLKAALSVAGGVAQGKPLDKVAISAATHALDGEAQDRVAAAVGHAAQEAAYSELTKSLPSTVSRALVSGVALGYARESQRDLHAAVTSPAARERLAKMGAETTAKSDVLRSAASEVPDRKAFDLGIGLMRCGGVTQPAVSYVRDTLSPRGKVSFDAALAIHVGAVSNPRFRTGTADKYKVGYYAVAGSVAGSPTQREGVVRLLSKNPAASSGAAAAVRTVRRRRSLWRRIVEWYKSKRRLSR